MFSLYYCLYALPEYYSCYSSGIVSPRNSFFILCTRYYHFSIDEIATLSYEHSKGIVLYKFVLVASPHMYADSLYIKVWTFYFSISTYAYIRMHIIRYLLSSNILTNDIFQLHGQQEELSDHTAHQ